MSVVVLQPIHHWYCPNCQATDVTHEARPHSRFHSCPKLRGISAPFVPAGTKAKVEARVREDYVGHEAVQTDDSGRAIMSVVTTRDDGIDTAVLAPTAQVTVTGH